MKIIKIASLVSILALAACGSSKHTTAVEPATTTYSLLQDDGVGVIFNATETTKGTPAQVKLYDETNELRVILNGETFPGGGTSDLALEYVPAKIVLFNVEYAGVAIDQIVCEKSNDTAYQLHFDDHKDNLDPAIAAEDGIYWEALVNMNGASVVSDRTFPCYGGGKNFDVRVFREDDITDPEFTLYFDFINKKFRGRMVVTEEGMNPTTDGVALNFN
jgi:hypothetical protein